MVTRPISRAHYGLKDWLIQRFTAAVLAGYTAYLLGTTLWHHPQTFVQWRALFDPLPMRIASQIFLVTILMHAWVGVRDIVMDYVRRLGVRLIVYLLVILALAFYGVWGTYIVWRAL